eukprot:scaffold192832_cov44-Prasinocladus_malaysianus.AAC.1
MALGSTLLVSFISLICLAALPLVYGVAGAQAFGRPPEWLMEAMTAFSGAAMLGDAFIHQIPHALERQSHHHDHGQGHQHSQPMANMAIYLADHKQWNDAVQEPGVIVIAGITLFFIIEKIMR